MAFPHLILVLALATFALGQRPFFAGSRPIGYPELVDRPTTEDLGNRFGEGDATTQRLPIEAQGDRDLVDRLSKLPKDKQPFWLLNWQALEANRKNPQTYPQKPNTFAESIASNSNGDSQSNSLSNRNTNSVNADKNSLSTTSVRDNPVTPANAKIDSTVPPKVNFNLPASDTNSAQTNSVLNTNSAISDRNGPTYNTKGSSTTVPTSEVISHKPVNSEDDHKIYYDPHSNDNDNFDDFKYEYGDFFHSHLNPHTGILMHNDEW